MKNNLSFIVLIASVMGFFMFSGICHATLAPVPPSAYFMAGQATITDNHITLDMSGFPNIGGYCTSVMWAFNEGVYPSISQGYGYGQFGCNTYHPTMANAENQFATTGSGEYDLYINWCDTPFDNPVCSSFGGSGGYLWRFILTGTTWHLWTDEPTIYITAPASASTITNLLTDLEVSFSSINHNTFAYMVLEFYDNKIGETSQSYTYAITADNGDFVVPLSTFNFTKNGDWTLRASIEYWGDYGNLIFDLSPSPPYYLTLDIEGLPTPYAFTSFDDWYDTNVSEYEAPSAWTENLVGFLQPMLEKIGEFGNRITDYLNVSDAYDKGFKIGGVFPVVIAYVNKINLFFGGFPIVQFFQWSIVAMVGIFAIKVILKLLSFIPVFGGGG